MTSWNFDDESAVRLNMESTPEKGVLFSFSRKEEN